MQKYVVLEKQIGETPLECAEIWRAAHPEYQGVPLAYAGRLDPIASGKLLILIGEECKKQTEYHGLDKTYEFEVLFGVQSDSGDVLGLVTECDAPELNEAQLRRVTKDLIGPVTLPYPKFSSKTVQGKPLHTWTLEGRLDEIKIPTYTSAIYKLNLIELNTLTREETYTRASKKIESIPPVTDKRKAIGNDFRRPDIRTSWQTFKNSSTDSNLGAKPLSLQVAKFTCLCSSGTYMRTLAEVIAGELGTCGLAFSIHRTEIGNYRPLPFGLGFWQTNF